MPFKSEAQQKFLYSQKPKIAKEFEKKTSKEDFKALPKKLENANFEDPPERLQLAQFPGKRIEEYSLKEVPERMQLGGSLVELASKFIKKEWNENKLKFDYIYPEDLERKSRKIAKETLKASEKDDIPKSLLISGPADRLHGGLGDRKSDSAFIKEQLKKGQKHEMEHTNKPVIAKEIAKDHLTENKVYYNKINKIESADMINKDIDHGSWSWGAHKYGERTGNKGDYKYTYDKGVHERPDEEAVAADVKQRERTRLIPGDYDDVSKTSNVNQGAVSSRPNKENIGFDDGRRNIVPLAAKQKIGAGHLPLIGKYNLNIDQTRDGGRSVNRELEATSPRDGMGLHMQHKQVIPIDSANSNNQLIGGGDPMGTGNTMAQQARNVGNVVDSRAVGTPNIAKQKSSLNPLSLGNLTMEQQQRLTIVHDIAKQEAVRSGGQKYTTIGPNVNFHSITIEPNNTVSDFVLGIKGMDLDTYMNYVPYQFAPNSL